MENKLNMVLATQKSIDSFKADLLKRLKGAPTNLACKDEKLYVGDKVKIYYDHMDPDKNVFGTVKYDSIKHIPYIRLKNIVPNLLKNNDKNLTSGKDLKYFSSEMEKISNKYHNDYKDCLDILENDKAFFQKILDLFYDEKVYLILTEIDWIERYLNKMDVRIEITNINNIDQEIYDKIYDKISNLLSEYFDNEEALRDYNIQLIKR